MIGKPRGAGGGLASATNGYMGGAASRGQKPECPRRFHSHKHKVTCLDLLMSACRLDSPVNTDQRLNRGYRYFQHRTRFHHPGRYRQMDANTPRFSGLGRLGFELRAGQRAAPIRDRRSG